VAPELRRHGLGRAIVAEGCVCYGQEYSLIAKIRESNTASKKILESCDFVCMGTVEDDVVAYLRPNDREDTIQ
jgi:L-amino acid N-acyltransferase YncA